jgi:peptide/nickel transport system substrate-binding protein
MENRFGFRDFVFAALFVLLLIVVLLAMKQYDRQYEQVIAISNKLDEQARELREIQQRLRRGVMAAAAAPDGQPLAQEDDPFLRLREVKQQPEYAPGDWLVEVFGGEVARLTPIISGDAYAATVQGNVLETLAQRNPDTLDWEPLLATQWSIDDNVQAYEKYLQKQKDAGRSDEEIAADPDLPAPITITFTIREGVRFSDGEPLTADDVVFTFNWIMDERIAAPRQRAYYEKIRTVEKQGDNEVVFSYREPYFEAFELAASLQVLPQHFYSRYEPEAFNQSVGLLLGSGPYRLPSATDWKPGTNVITLVRNERYWGESPAFERMVFNTISNDTARVTAFRNGNIDIIGLPPEQYRELLNDRQLLDRTNQFEYLAPTSGYRYVAWNQQRQGKPTHFDDKRVRQALAMLVNRERLLQEITLGFAVPTTGPFNPLSQQFDPDLQPWPYDVQRAQSLLAEAGFVNKTRDGVLVGPDGRPFIFKLTYPSGSANYERMVLFLRDAYTRAGIVVEPDPLEWAVFTQRLENKDFDAITLGWTSGIETDIYQMFDSSQMMAGGDNFMSYRSEELDGAIRAARREVDEERRMPMWRQAHRILHEDQPYMFLWFGKSLVFVDDRIQNARETKMGLTPRTEWYVPQERQRWTR